MRTAAWFLAMCGAVVVGACASNGLPEGSGDGSRPDVDAQGTGAPAGDITAQWEPDECVTGLVRTGGTVMDPQVVIRPDGPEGAPAVTLLGGRTAQVRQLSGTVVTVCGARTGANRIEPVAVELREVDGLTAYLGVLRRREGRWEVVRERDAGVVQLGFVPLGFVPTGLTEAAGRTVWVSGVWGRVFEVRAYGVLEGSDGGASTTE